MLPMLSAVAGFLKVRYLVNHANIDNVVFKAHYKLTTTILFGCSILVTANHLIGNPISCITDGPIPGHIINTFCWITHTFTLPNKIGNGKYGTHPGISSYNKKEDQVRYHSYYQWVPFVLFFQGILFYVPHWLWKNWEEGKIAMITDRVRCDFNELSEERINRQKQLVQYLIVTLHTHNVYAIIYFLCEILNFLNVVGNMFLIDRFLGGEFLTYGIKVLEFSQMDQENRYDPMVAMFPRLTKCTFNKFGPSGSIQTQDALCVSAMNILNEKIYIFLWYWFIILAIISGLALLYSIALMIPSIRKTLLIFRLKIKTSQSVSTLIKEIQVGDYLFLHLLGQNMNKMQFTEVLYNLNSRLSNNSQLLH